MNAKTELLQNSPSLSPLPLLGGEGKGEGIEGIKSFCKSLVKGKFQKGFTFVEIMVAISILSLGSVMVHQSNLSSLDVYGRYTRRLSIQNWADKKVWETKEAIYSSDAPDVSKSSGEIVRQGKKFFWEMNIEDTEIKDLYLVRLDITWQERRDKGRLTRGGFVQKPEMISS